MKLLIIGGLQPSVSLATQLRSLNDFVEILILEEGSEVDVILPALPYYCGSVIDDSNSISHLTPANLKELFNIETRTYSQVLELNRENKQVKVLDLITQKTYLESYDKLVLATGCNSYVPKIAGINNYGIFALNNINNAVDIRNFIKTNEVKSALVVGGGSLGVEMVENLANLGLKTTLVDASQQILNFADYEIASKVEIHLKDKGVEILTNTKVVSFEEQRSLEKGVIKFNASVEVLDELPLLSKDYPKIKGKFVLEADIIILSLGVTPNVDLAQRAGLVIGETGGIEIDNTCTTSDANIYALGDCVEVYDTLFNAKKVGSLVSIANQQARVIANNLHNITSTFKGVHNNMIVKVFNMVLGIAGAKELDLLKNQVRYLKTYYHGYTSDSFYPNAMPIVLKLLFTPEGNILGIQAVGSHSIDKYIDIISSLITLNGTIKDLLELELAYSPPFASAKNILNMLGQSANNILHNLVRPIYADNIDNIIHEDSFIIDVRSSEDFSTGNTLHNAYNIPVKNLKNRLHEIPKNKDIIVYCEDGTLSYIACRILFENAYTKVFMLNGGSILYHDLQKKKNYEEISNTKNVQSLIINPSIKKVIIDACLLSYPQIFLKLKHAMSHIQQGEYVEIKMLDEYGFKEDIKAWCISTSHIFVGIEQEYKSNFFIAVIQKQNQLVAINEPNNKHNKTLFIFSNDLDKALTSLMLANTLASGNYPVTIFFSFWGLSLLRKKHQSVYKQNILSKIFNRIVSKSQMQLSKKNYLGISAWILKKSLSKHSMMNIKDLLQNAKESGVKFVACSHSMAMLGLTKDDMIDGVSVEGLVSYINEAEHSNLNLFM
jgi:NADPH-dependent 2,4-dienoyl-CoA reductase/sulfur reductase-like enzyme/peroxiredoxin family protein/rhodanese-related sulfurtransferase/TusA-related sulfurtransferase